MRVCSTWSVVTTSMRANLAPKSIVEEVVVLLLLLLLPGKLTTVDPVAASATVESSD